MRNDAMYTKHIECPLHEEGDGKHIATVYLYGHEYAGQVECSVDFASEMCEHPETHVEEIENMSSNPDSSHVWYSKIYVCDVCECQADGDPEVDRAEYLAEMASDLERGK